MTSHPDTSPPEPLTADEVREARRIVRFLSDETGVLSVRDKQLLARAYLALERCAELMADGWSGAGYYSEFGFMAETIKHYRRQFPRPRAEKDATHV